MDDDIEAIRRLKEGDISGLEVLVTRYQRKAVQTAFLILHDEQLAEDIAQDTFVRLYQHIRSFDEARPFAPYLLRSVVNAALNNAEKTARWVQYGSGTNVESVADLLILASSTEELVEKERLKEQVASALASLPPRQRAVIVQRYYLGMNEKEMAASLSVAAGTIKWLLNKARESLREIFSAERNSQ